MYIMKKNKIMLLSLLVAGAVGGAVAFKVRKGDTALCGPRIDLCPIIYPAVTFTDPEFAIEGLFCTNGDDTSDCPFSVTSDM